MKKNLLLTFQLSIILGCSVVLIHHFYTRTATAQSLCNGQPPLEETENPLTNAWRAYTTYTVVDFYSSSEEQHLQIRDAPLPWNIPEASGNCSGVVFRAAVPSQTPYDPNATIPNDTVWYYRSTRSQFNPIHRFVPGTSIYEIRAGKVELTYPWASRVENTLMHTATHELGHGYGFTNSDPPCVTIMCGGSTPTTCDIEGIKRIYCPILAPTPTPTPTPTPPPPPPPYCEVPYDPYTWIPTGCPSGRTHDPVTACCTCYRSQQFIQQCFQNGGDYDPYLCGCTGSCQDGGGCSPIVVDVLGNGFDLTSVDNGVPFDLAANGISRQSAWVSVSSDDAWLVLDRNRNGLIDNGKELFGNVTVQDIHPPGVERNGFLALAEYDKVMNGGNNDGNINRNDSVFDRLRLWRDDNHNGVSEACELFALRDFGLRRIDLDYRESSRVDSHGNQFKFRSRVYDNDDAQLGGWAWDVFLVVQQ
jgi:hypothetical protein